MDDEGDANVRLTLEKEVLNGLGVVEKTNDEPMWLFNSLLTMAMNEN